MPTHLPTRPSQRRIAIVADVPDGPASVLGHSARHLLATVLAANGASIEEALVVSLLDAICDAALVPWGDARMQAGIAAAMAAIDAYAPNLVLLLGNDPRSPTHAALHLFKCGNVAPPTTKGGKVRWEYSTSTWRGSLFEASPALRAPFNDLADCGASCKDADTQESPCSGSANLSPLAPCASLAPGETQDGAWCAAGEAVCASGSDAGGTPNLPLHHAPLPQLAPGSPVATSLHPNAPSLTQVTPLLPFPRSGVDASVLVADMRASQTGVGLSPAPAVAGASTLATPSLAAATAGGGNFGASADSSAVPPPAEHAAGCDPNRPARGMSNPVIPEAPLFLRAGDPLHVVTQLPVQAMATMLANPARLTELGWNVDELRDAVQRARRPYKCLPTWHPSFVARAWGHYLYEFRADVRRAVEEAASPTLALDQFDIAYGPTT